MFSHLSPGNKILVSSHIPLSKRYLKVGGSDCPSEILDIHQLSILDE